mmetsp:Transcript_35021/g.48754  ORF Transcript_35021/g.48754 Transcript_35021/m.48754 type:complete len:84 (+) Transcript_35021:158-409(+)
MRSQRASLVRNWENIFHNLNTIQTKILKKKLHFLPLFLIFFLFPRRSKIFFINSKKIREHITRNSNEIKVYSFFKNLDEYEIS